MSEKPHDYYKRLYEAYAKMFVENIYNKSWRNCFFMSEKPDLQSKTLNIGIEVTSSLDSRIQCAHHAFNKYVDKKIDGKTLKKIVTKRDQNAICQTNPLMVGLDKNHDTQENNELNDLICSIKNKTQDKLPSYMHYKKNMLYIFTESSLFCEEEIKLVWNALKDIFLNVSLQFDFYFIDCIDKVFTLSADDGNVVEYNVSPEEMHKFTAEAERIAMEYN